MEAIIRYNSKKDFEEITAFGKERGFTVIENGGKPREREHGDFKCTYVNGMPMIMFQPDIATEDGEDDITGLGLNAKDLRTRAWKR